jgi:hypothetical protein
MSHHQAQENRDARIANKSFEIVAVFKNLGKTVTNQNCFYDKIRNRLGLHLGNGCYHLLNNLPIFYLETSGKSKD